MIYVEFYAKSAIPEDDHLVPACGDRGVVILDGRNSPSAHNEIAEAECKKRGYLAWRLFVGESFTRSRPASDVHYL